MVVLSTLWAGHSSAVCWQRVQRGAKRNREGEKNKINRHRRATLHQDCYCTEKGREGGRGGEAIVHELRTFRKLEKGRLMERGEPEVRTGVVIERNNLFDVTIEEEREDETRST